VRVPMLAISPFSRGGNIASEVFDHTSQLKLVSERFGVEVPNVSAWRRATVGDLTSTMFQSSANATVPKLPATSVVMPLSGTCAAYDQDTESGGAAPSVPTKQTMPTQGGGSQPASQYYLGTSEQETGVPDHHRTTIGVAGSALVTTKSAYNDLTRVSR
jgi:phospholipase C